MAKTKIKPVKSKTPAVKTQTIVYKPKGSKTNSQEKRYWFNEPDPEKLANSLQSYMTQLLANQREFWQNAQDCVGMYMDSYRYTFAQDSYTAPTSAIDRLPKLSLNVVRSLVDTAVNKIAQTKPLPMFLTEGGDYSQQTKAEQLNKFTEGLFYELDVFVKMQEAFKDAAIFGSGYLKIFTADDKKISVERVFPNEIIVDTNQSLFGEPNCLYQRKTVQRDVLAAAYPEFKDQIYAADSSKVTIYSTKDFAPDCINVTEAWYIGPSDLPGRHVIAIDNATLHTEEYEDKYFPFAVIRWEKEPLGYYGTGICKIVRPLQFAINAILRTISKSIKLVGVPRVLIPIGSNINPNHLTDDVGSVVFHAPGMPPQILTQPILPPDVYQHLQFLIQQCYQMAGINELSAAGKKPSGVDSGVAMRELTDIQADRFAIVEQNYEGLGLEVAKQCVNLAQKIYKKEGEFAVSARDSKTFQKIDWGDIGLSADEFIMKLYPTNLLPKTPAGRLQQVTEMMQQGLLSTTEAKQLLDYPDLEAITSLENAPLENIMKTITMIIEDGKYQPPEQYQDLTNGIKIVQQSYLKYKNQGVPFARLELLLNWILQAQSILDSQNPPQPPMPAGPPPGGTPPPAPQQ